MTYSIWEIVLACLISSLALWAEHYSPWRAWLGKALSRPAAYTLGTLAMLAPVCGLYGFWMEFPPRGNGFGWALIALGSDVVVSGLTVYALYLADRVHLWKVKGEEVNPLILGHAQGQVYANLHELEKEDEAE